MRYILENANIFATNIKYMNDSEEYANGINELNNIYKSKMEKREIPREKIDAELEKDVPIYSISFSGARDLLSQWSMYAGESGVSIRMQFDKNEKYKVVAQKHGEAAQMCGERQLLVKDNVFIYPKKVWYCTKAAMKVDDYEDEVEKIWEAIHSGEEEYTASDIDESFVGICRNITPYIKHAEFKAEQEYRLVFEKSQWRNGDYDFKIDYRNCGNVLKPYLDVVCENGWPIHEIIIGPGSNQDIVFKSVRHFLNNAKLSVPKLNVLTYLSRFEEYLKLCGDMPTIIQDLWIKQKEDASNRNSEAIYDELCGTKRRIINLLEGRDAATEFLDKINKTEFTKTGIILSRSRIPYVFER